MKKIILFNAEDQSDIIVEQEMIDKTKYEIILLNDQDDSRMGELCAEADGIITIYSPVTTDTVAQLKKCKCIALQAIGFNNIDLDAVTEKGIAIANVPDYCLQEVAAHTIALALSCIRRVSELSARVKKHQWDYSGQKIHRLSSLKYGLIAFGNIAKTMVPMLKGMGFSICAFDPMAPQSAFDELGVERKNTIEDLLKESDIVSVHLPLNKNTENFMDEAKFRFMKKDAYFINTSRGGIVDEEALYHALTEKWIAGAALDVLKEEKECNSPLIDLDQVIITPHIAFYSEESAIQMRKSAMEQLLQVLEEGELPSNLVNKKLRNR